MASSARPSAASPRRASPTRWRRPASRSTGSRSPRRSTATPSLGVPVLAAYIQAHPNLKAIGTQHGGVTGIMAEVLKKAGKKPGDIVVGGIDLAPGDDRRAEVGLRQRDPRPAPLPAGLHAGRAMRDDAPSTRCPAGDALSFLRPLQVRAAPSWPSAPAFGTMTREVRGIGAGPVLILEGTGLRPDRALRGAPRKS